MEKQKIKIIDINGNLYEDTVMGYETEENGKVIVVYVNELKRNKYITPPKKEDKKVE